MKNYLVTLKVHSPLITPILGDTLFGHICWGIVYHEGEKALMNFLEPYDQGNPHLILSNGFPDGMVPVPLLKPKIPSYDLSLEQLQKIKKAKKQKYMPFDYFTDESFKFSEDTLIDQFTKSEAGKSKYSFHSWNLNYELRFHNTINRITGTTDEKTKTTGLYSVKELFYKRARLRFNQFQSTEEVPIINIYICSDLDQDRIQTLFKWGLEKGYGADISTGKGNLVFDDIEPIEFPNTGARAMSLGNFVPGFNETLHNLRADVITKYGKLGGDFVLYMNPFKKPIVMYQEGATFDNPGNKKYVGRLLKDIHKDKRIRHYAFAPLIYFNEEE